MPAPQKRQRLLYLHANGTNPRSEVVAFELHEPTREVEPPRLCPQPEMPYQTVREAMADGWRVIHFPAQTTAVPDRELGHFAYEFILEKIEDFSD